MDVEGHIKPGDDFAEVLSKQVGECDVLLAVIGPRWADLLAARQSDPDDFVAIEIKAALDQGKRVIPVLVGGASMARTDTLPETIRALARRNAVGLRRERFRTDCQGLIAALKESLAAAGQERAARTEAERKAAEAARLEAEAQAAARARAAEERGRVQAAAGLSAEEIRKAEELASWDFVKERNDVQDLRDHLARFPSGTTERYAIAKLDGLVWAGLGATPLIEGLRAYVDEFPKGANAGVAQARIAVLEREAEEVRTAEQRRTKETEAWGAVAASTDRTAIEAFLVDWPQGQYAAAAQARITELQRRSGGMRRGILLGAGAMAAAVAFVAGGWWAYDQWQWRASLSDPSLKVLARSAQKALKTKDTFRECATCPEMVVVPAGEFMMGSSENEKGRADDEGPLHSVKIAKPFAVSKFAITFNEWDACVEAGACNRYQPSDKGWGRGTRPVINASWFDARAYAEWLSAKTGHHYRLLTEAEWEYAARAGSKTSYPWGNDISRGNANCHGCGSQWDDQQTAPVGSFKPNAFGLYDMHGNVWQWVEDCYETYNGAPTDGSARTTGTCSQRVVRGGSWDYYPRSVRSANRHGWGAVDRYINRGFRLARTLLNH
jgi:formylglycine-generating enzyme required for sulfatase activity